MEGEEVMINICYCDKCQSIYEIKFQISKTHDGEIKHCPGCAGILQITGQIMTAFRYVSASPPPKYDDQVDATARALNSMHRKNRLTMIVETEFPETKNVKGKKK